jgi:hypothetical protein
MPAPSLGPLQLLLFSDLCIGELQPVTSHRMQLPSRRRLSAMLLLGTLASLGWGTLLIGELPRHPERQGPLLTTAILVTATVGAALGVLFALVGPLFFVRLRAFNGDIWVVGLFALGVSLTAATLVLDQAVIGMLRGSFSSGGM